MWQSAVFLLAYIKRILSEFKATKGIINRGTHCHTFEPELDRLLTNLVHLADYRLHDEKSPVL